MYRSAIYAGSFDPLTYGHLDVIQRAARIFERLIVAVASNSRKVPYFSVAEREDLCRASVLDLPNVEVTSFNGLLVEYARQCGVHVLIRGLRAFSDFEFEFQMALTNRTLAPDVETMFLMPKEDYSYVNSGTVREVAAMGGDVSQFAPPPVVAALGRKQRGG